MDPRQQLIGLAISCPYEEANPQECPLHDLRKLPLEARYTTINAMNEQEVERIIQFHGICSECRRAQTERQANRPGAGSFPERSDGV